MEMDDHIPEHRKDELFFYAEQIVHDMEADCWEIHVNPDECLTGYANNVDVPHSLEAIGNSDPTVHKEGSRVIYEGRLLFSAGVILLIDDHMVMQYRDPGAPVDPCRWTSPAGRCDTTPEQTARQELYEELLVLAGDRPAHVVISGEEQLTGVYQQTLRHNGIHSPTTDWETIPTNRPPRYNSVISTVETYYGNENYIDKFWAYFDDSSSTLELRYVKEMNVPDSVPMVRFSDAEYSRETALFSQEELQSLPDDELVPANEAFRNVIA